MLLIWYPDILFFEENQFKGSIINFLGYKKCLNMKLEWKDN